MGMYGEGFGGGLALGLAAAGTGGSVLRLTDPEGLLFSNDAISTIFARLDERVEERDGAAAAL